VIVLYALWPRRLPRGGPIRLVVSGQGLLMVSAVAELYLEAPYTSGTSIFGASQENLREIFGSQYGAAHLIRLGVLAAVAVLLRPFLAAPDSDGTSRATIADRALLAILAVVGLATWPLSGHSGSSRLAAVTTVADIVHLAAMSLWLGGLVMMFGYLLRLANRRELDALMPVWSRWATWAVGVLILAGTVQAVVQIDDFGGLFGTRYGQLVLVKIGLLGLVLAAASFARRLVRAGGDEPDRARALRRLVGVELAVLAIVIGVTSALVQTTPSRAALTVADGQRSTGPYSVTLTSSLYALEFNLAPPRVGDNGMHLYAYNSAGEPKNVLEWKVTMALPEQGIEPIDLPLLPVNENHALGEVRIPVAGNWEFRFTLRVSDIDQATVSVRVTIK
jgi:copper transport protein